MIVSCTAALVMGVLSGCNASPPGSPQVRDGGSETVDLPPPPPLELTWEPCGVRGMAGNAGQCATVQVPLSWDDPTGERVPTSVKRFHSTEMIAGHLWILIGGPGLSGDWLDNALPIFEAIAPDFEVFMPSYRGTGSERLRCPDQETINGPGRTEIIGDEWGACAQTLEAQWGDRLALFSTDQTARDIGALIDATSEPGVPVYIFAVSYGTALALTYLHHFPEQPDGVILDSVLPLGTASFPLGFEDAHNRIARELMAECGRVEECSSRLGSDPWQSLVAASESLDAGHCPGLSADGIDRGRFRQMLGYLLERLDTRELIPALVHRLTRCDASDVAAIEWLSGIIPTLDDPGFFPPEARNDSVVLRTQLILSEFSTDPVPSSSAYEQALSGLHVAPNFGGEIANAASVWPSSGRQPSALTGCPATQVPLMVLSGGLDPQTPPWIADDFASCLQAPHQQLVRVPRACHDVLSSSPLASGGLTCGMRLTRDFLEDPTGSLDATCASRAAPIDFRNEPSISMALLGTADMW